MSSDTAYDLIELRLLDFTGKSSLHNYKLPKGLFTVHFNHSCSYCITCVYGQTHERRDECEPTYKTRTEQKSAYAHARLRFHSNSSSHTFEVFHQIISFVHYIILRKHGDQNSHVLYVEFHSYTVREGGR